MPSRLVRILVCFALVVGCAGAVSLMPGCTVDEGTKDATRSGSASEVPTNSSSKSSGTGTEQSNQQPGEETMYTASYKPNGNEVAAIKTPKGVIKFKFYPKDAPNTVAAFIELALKGFYDGTKFHRVVPGFVIQGGDPLSKTDDPVVGSGGPGYRLKAEFDPATNTQKHLDGAVAMARSQDPDSAGSQFYITLGPQPALDGQYTVFGQVISGMDVVRAIEKNDVIESVTIENAN